MEIITLLPIGCKAWELFSVQFYPLVGARSVTENYFPGNKVTCMWIAPNDFIIRLITCYISNRTCTTLQRHTVSAFGRVHITEHLGLHIFLDPLDVFQKLVP